MLSAVEIKVLKSSDELQQVQVLEKEVWNTEPIPLHQTITASQNGGLLLGAFIDGNIVGFSYSFPGFRGGKSYLCSHMLGIHPDYQDQGIGAMLKAKQKQVASDMGYDLITWTYDPLESRNAYLNLTKLRAVCSTYVENCYGEMQDSLNSGLPSDRFKVEWWINSSHASEPQAIKITDARHIFQWDMTDLSLPKLEDFMIGLSAVRENNQPLYVPVPSNFQALKSKDDKLAIDWRFKTRKIFQTLFSSGYAAVSLVKGETAAVNYYLLIKRESLDLD
ncbi:GCN5-related N-acetyltransferase [Bacillus methanolicus PB1]|uniref:GCN5-related N-acetyltransferase n=1 Tax=Bacillus methanolicus PB1 TaxID=997296 RepID=I3DVJ4_BACMT|nr:GNAT family N-acetyltransferase [Bacillus methanolicus]EIJ78265.1 GCN5-related N-acetyltransferase [Bacillus methanolicus PB1]